MKVHGKLVLFAMLSSLLFATHSVTAADQSKPAAEKPVKVFLIADEDGTKTLRVQVDDEEISIEGADDKGRKILKKKLGTTRRGFLGVYLTGLTPELRTHFGAPPGQGVMVAKLVPDGPAEKAGVRVGDVIVAIDGREMDSAWSIGQAIGDKSTGDLIRMSLVRGGKQIRIPVSIESKSRPVVDLSACIKKGPDGIRFNASACGDELEREVEQALKTSGLEDKLRRVEKLEKKLEEEIEQGLEEKMKKLEDKLKQLEKKLQGSLRPPRVEPRTS